MLQPQYLDERRIDNPRIARGASETRRKKTTRSRYAPLSRFSIGLGLSLALLIGYVTATSNLTGMTYAVTKAETQRAALQGTVGRIDDRLVTLRSQERLAQFAARLGMKEPQQFALIRIAPPQTAQGVALLSSFAAFFGKSPNAPSVR